MIEKKPQHQVKKSAAYFPRLIRVRQGSCAKPGSLNFYEQARDVEIKLSVDVDAQI